MISSMRGGGSEQQTLLLLQHLDRSRFVPQLYLTDRAGDLLPQVPSDVVVHAYSDAPFQPRFYFPGQALRRQTKLLEQLLQGEAIEVIYDRTFHMTMLAGTAGHELKIPRVSTIVSPPELALPMVEKRFVGLKRRRLARDYRRSQRVLAVSQQAADSAERYYGLPSGSTDVLRNPVDRRRIMELSQQTVPSRDDRLTLVCVGRMTEEKGHRDLLAALKIAQSKWPPAVRGLRVWLIGDGPLRAELERECAQSNLLEEVEFMGRQSNPAPFIKAADALVLPSHFEGMPNVVLEAMSLETPVIATRAGGTVELQRDAPTILWAQPGMPQSLADAMLQFASNRDAARTRALTAKALIREHHDLERCVARIENYLLQACERARER